MPAYAVELTEEQVKQIKQRFGVSSNSEVREVIQEIVEEVLNGNAG